MFFFFLSNPPKSDTPRLDDLNATLFVSGSDGEPGLGNDFGQPLPGGPLNGGQAQRPLVSGPGGGASKWWEMVTASSSVRVSNSMTHQVALMAAAE